MVCSNPLPDSPENAFNRQPAFMRGQVPAVCQVVSRQCYELVEAGSSTWQWEGTVETLVKRGVTFPGFTQMGEDWWISGEVFGRLAGGNLSYLFYLSGASDSYPETSEYWSPTSGTFQEGPSIPDYVGFELSCMGAINDTHALLISPSAGQSIVFLLDAERQTWTEMEPLQDDRQVE